MYNSREEAFEKIMLVINELYKENNLLKENIAYSEANKAICLINYIDKKISETKESINELKHPFLLFIIGSGNYGKSTLINTLLEDDIVVTNDIPNTWKLDLFIKGKSEKIEITYEDNKKDLKSVKEGKLILDKEEAKFKESKKKITKKITEYKVQNKVSISELKEYKKKLEDTHLYKSKIVQIKYYLKKQGLLNDFIIVDTPGLNQTLLKNTLERMKEYYIKCDGVIWLIDGCNIVSKETNKLIDEMNNIDTLDRNNKNIIAVVNKMDIIREQNILNVDKVKIKTREIYKDKFKDIVYISAKEAKEGILKNQYDLIDKSNINILYKSIEKNFKDVSQERQISSKYKNLLIMKEDVLKFIYEYKRVLYKDISIYNESEFEFKKNMQDVYDYIIKYLENEKNKIIYCNKGIEKLRDDIEILQNRCSLDFEKNYKLTLNKITLNQNIKCEEVNTKVYFSKSKHLIPNYHIKKNIENANQYTKKIENIVSKIMLTSSQTINNDEFIIKQQINKKINNLKEEIKEIILDKIEEIEKNITQIKKDSFRNKYSHYCNIKNHLDHLNNIEKILNNLR
ncbi:MAG: dynamin family protein [Romboutsia sp.]|uniref:dynamin family protein n=1 Tax=Romboutsia sp. TaxID=1965302 RepID=UPI003F3610E4